MKTAELTGPLLGYWTARATDQALPFIRDGICFTTYHEAEIEFSPHTDWAQGAPLFEKYSITLGIAPVAGLWEARAWRGGYGSWCFGLTPLIAICRAVVSVTFGDEVKDLP